MSDIIRLTNMIFYAHHGYYQAERELGQKFEVDLELECNLSRAIQTDNLEDTVNFEQIYHHVNSVFNSYKFTLLETVADKILQDILNNFPVKAARIRVRKPQVPLHGFLDHVEIELYRSQQQ